MDGGGGSSYISGHVGCDAIAETSTQDKIVHTGQENHYSGYVFGNTVMIDGLGYQWEELRENKTEMPEPPTQEGVDSKNGFIKISQSKGTVTKNKKIAKEYKFSYTENVQEFIVEETGLYRIECWGGGSESSVGGYTRGKIQLEAGTKLYLYTGGMSNSITGGYNGGGNGGSYGGAAYGGAGATDIRLIKGDVNEFASLKSRIMVAGGAGATVSSDQQLPYAGGLTGYDSRSTAYIAYGGKGGKQTQGGELASNYSGIAGLTAGGFGIGGNGNRARTAGFGGGRRWRILWWIWRKWSIKWRLGPVVVVLPISQDMLAVMR